MINLKNKKILVTGGTGFVGKHLIDNLINVRGVNEKLISTPTSKDFDLNLYSNAQKVVKGCDIVFNLVGDVGGSGYSRTHPATQFYKTLVPGLQVLEAAKEAKVEKIVMVGSTCAYPENAPQPLHEADLYGGLPNPSLDGYGMAKRTLAFAAEIYRREFGLNVVVVLPNNAYGPGDDFDLESGHVIPSLIRRALTEQALTIWGDGTPTRDFLYVKDFVEGVILAGEKLETSAPVNLGSGKSISIKDLVSQIVALTNFKGKVVFEADKPQGMIKRSVDIARADKLLGFKPSWTLRNGLKETIDWYKSNL